MDPAIIWFLIGLGLILAELVIPGVILVFIGVAAWIVAILDWCGVTSFSIQMWVFGISSALLVVFARRYVKGWFRGKETVSAGDLDEEFVGKIVTVVTAIESGDVGRVELKGAQWSATSETAIPEGARAEVIARDNLSLKVKPHP